MLQLELMGSSVKDVSEAVGVSMNANERYLALRDSHRFSAAEAMVFSTRVFLLT